GRAVADGHEQVTARVDRRSGRGPDARLASGRHGVLDGFAPGCAQPSDDAALVLAAVAGEPAERHEHPGAVEGERAALLHGGGVDALQVEAAPPLHVPGAEAQRDELVARWVAAQLRSDEDRAGRRVVDGRAGDAERVDVAARPLALRRGRAEVPLP